MLRALGLSLPHSDTPGPGVENFTAKDFKRLRALVREEAAEFDEAMSYLEESINLKKRTNGEMGDANILDAWAQVIDGMCDTIVVIHNTACSMNLDLEPFFNEVHRTNMEKADGPVRESDGKKLKPEGWQPPKIQELLEDQLRRYKNMELNEVGEPTHTKEPLVALIYELVRDYIYHEGFEKILHDQFELPQAKGGWHLTDSRLAKFAIKAVEELARQRRIVMGESNG